MAGETWDTPFRKGGGPDQCDPRSRRDLVDVKFIKSGQRVTCGMSRSCPQNLKQTPMTINLTSGYQEGEDLRFKEHPSLTTDPYPL